MSILAAAPRINFANEKVVPFSSAKRETTAYAPQTDPEIDAVARLLCSLSSHSNLWGALLSYRADLPQDKAMLWAEQVIRRMDKLVPSPAHRKLYQYGKPWLEQSAEPVQLAGGEPKATTSARMVLPALILGGLGVFAMSMIGFVATYHRLLAH